MSEKKKPTAFNSFRIIGKKAQKMLEKARKGIQEEKEQKHVQLPRAPEREEVLMHLSLGSVVKATFTILAILAGTWMVFTLRDKLILLLLAIFIAIVIDPSVHFMERWRIPRGVAVLLHFFIALSLVLFLFLSFIPILAEQITRIAQNITDVTNAFLADPQIHIPLLTEELNQQLEQLVTVTLQNLSIYQFADALRQLGQNLTSAAQVSVVWTAKLAGSVVNFFVSLIVVFVLAFFMQLEKEQILKWFRGFLPAQLKPYLDSKSEAIHLKLGQWARGELVLMISIFTLTLIALLILGMQEYALTLAILAGFCEFIPAAGPLIAAVPAVFIALSERGFVWALVIAGVYYVIQWCENNLLVPLIMRRAVGLSPIAILFAMMVGISFPETIHPVLGIMLAVPTTTVLALFLEDWREIRRRAD